jgi:DNA helicase-2/ATP-dependent DNA helicase PcrA
MPINLTKFNLNANQLEAVQWQHGPLLALAGPGSGKTKVLTLRIARLIAESADDRFRVLGVTFTNKAATEMRNRIDGLLSDGRDRATLTTFHSFAAEILRQHGSHIGLKPDFGILSEQADREAVLSDAIKLVPIEDEDFTPKSGPLLPFLTRMMDECILPSEARAALGNQANAADIAAIYIAYRERLIAANQMDFASLLALAVELLEMKPAIAKQIRRVYSHVCVDEFQDTNAAQFRLLVQLVPEKQPNLFVVADDDQVLYQWNGASPARLNELLKRYNMLVLQLPENYRCPPAVIELANNLIRHNSDRAADKKPLRAHKVAAATDALTAKHFTDFDNERLWLAKTLAAMTPDERAHAVVLARRKKLLEDTVTTLTAKNVPAYIAIRRNEFQSPQYRWLHATLRLANAPQDREQLRRMTKAFYQLEGIAVEVDEVVARASVEQAGLLRAWLETVDGRQNVEVVTKKVLAAESKELAERLGYWPFVAAAHEWFNDLAKSRKPDAAFADFDDEKEIWKALQTEIAQHYTLSDLSLHTFLQELDLRAKEKPVPRGAVRCLTIAASKGMEFRHVFLIGLVEDELPGYHARKPGADADQMREERRNCFVAITRVELSLTLTYADSYYGYAKSPSRFLKEMGFKV